MLQRLIDALAGEVAKPKSFWYKLVAQILGAVVFLAAVPALLFLAGVAIEKYLLVSRWEELKIAVGYAGVVLGLVILGWSLLVFAFKGRGTAVPLAPPEKLIVTGPYKYCRNPIQLGAILYYLGVGILFGSVAIGVLMLLLGLVIGGVYHKFVEERELVARFGDEYRAYKAKTPFIIPKCRRD